MSLKRYIKKYPKVLLSKYLILFAIVFTLYSCAGKSEHKNLIFLITLDTTGTIISLGLIKFNLGLNGLNKKLNSYIEDFSLGLWYRIADKVNKSTKKNKDMLKSLSYI